MFELQVSQFKMFHQIGKLIYTFRNRARRGRWLYKYGTILSKTPARVVVITITAVVLAVSMYGNYELVEEFDPWLFIPKDLYVSKWKYAQVWIVLITIFIQLSLMVQII